MPYNPSLAKFKTTMKNIRNQLRVNVHQAMLNTAQEIADNMKAAAPKDKGVLADSVRVQDNTRIGPASSRLSVKIKAGGAMTRRRNAQSGEVYDYSAAVEFGTQDMAPEPFFYNTFRRYRSAWPDTAAETLEQTIEQNRKILDERAGAAGRNTGGRHKNVVVGKQGN
jgi:HK97 gp10 family phage protein